MVLRTSVSASHATPLATPRNVRGRWQGTCKWRNGSDTPLTRRQPGGAQSRRTLRHDLPRWSPRPRLWQSAGPSDEQPKRGAVICAEGKGVGDGGKVGGGWGTWGRHRFRGAALAWSRRTAAGGRRPPPRRSWREPLHSATGEPPWPRGSDHLQPERKPGPSQRRTARPSAPPYRLGAWYLRCAGDARAARRDCLERRAWQSGAQELLRVRVGWVE